MDGAALSRAPKLQVWRHTAQSLQTCVVVVQKAYDTDSVQYHSHSHVYMFAAMCSTYIAHSS